VAAKNLYIASGLTLELGIWDIVYKLDINIYHVLGTGNMAAVRKSEVISSKRILYLH